MAYAARRRAADPMRALTGLMFALWLARPFPLSAQPGPTTAEALRASQRQELLGTVAGRVYGEAKRTGQAEQPLTGTRVTLLPDSTDLRGDLARARERARSSPTAHAASGGDVRRIVDRYVRALHAAGAGDLVRLTEVDDEGAFRLERVPAGAWLLLASRTVPVERHASAASRKERETFILKPGFVGYDAVSLWLRDLTVVAGQTAVLELSDRGIWMTGIDERRGGGAGR